jgi:hypothetical protein
VIRAHQPGSEPIDIPETIPNPVVVPKPTPTPTEPAPKEPVRTPEKVPNGTQNFDGYYEVMTMRFFTSLSSPSATTNCPAGPCPI